MRAALVVDRAGWRGRLLGGHRSDDTCYGIRRIGLERPQDNGRWRYLERAPGRLALERDGDGHHDRSGRSRARLDDQSGPGGRLSLDRRHRELESRFTVRTVLLDR